MTDEDEKSNVLLVCLYEEEEGEIRKRGVRLRACFAVRLSFFSS